MGDRSPRAVVARVQAPTSVVWGDRDRLVDVATAPRAAGTHPDVRLLVPPGVGHVAQTERPETVARAFLGMLRSSAPGRAEPDSGSGCGSSGRGDGRGGASERRTTDRRSDGSGRRRHPWWRRV